MKQANGKWVIGEDFWGRESEIQILNTRICEGAHTLLVAQRRMGKTSLMHELIRRLGIENQCICLFVDFQKSKDASDAIVELSLSTKSHQPLWNKTKEAFKNIFQTASNKIESINLQEVGIKLRAGLTTANWRDKGDEIFQLLATADRPVILFWDEVPILINRILKGDDYHITPQRRAQADAFLSWLRDNSLKYQKTIHIFLTGSIGLEPILRQAGLSATINNFVPFELKPWDKATAQGCLNQLARNYGIILYEGVTDSVVDHLGYCIPHHVQMFFSHIHDYCLRKKVKEFRVDEVKTVYETEMLSIRGHAELSHYEERLKMVLGEERFKIALDILTEASIGNGISITVLKKLQEWGGYPMDVLREVLWVLEHDGYLTCDRDCYSFNSKLLKDWWRSRNSLFFTRVSDRKSS